MIEALHSLPSFQAAPALNQRGRGLCAHPLLPRPNYHADVHTLTELRGMLEARGLSPRKAFGQNFLIDQNLLRKLVDASGVREGDVVLEVGPGAGALTEALLDRGCQVVACEIDHGLADLLEDRFAETATGRLTLIRGDCLASKRSLNPTLVRALCGRSFSLVANLPYGAATPLLMTLLIQRRECGAMHVTIQKEVADRLLARPGSKDYGELSVVAQAAASIERIATAPPECFWPRPKVTSAMISLLRRKDPPCPDLSGLAEFTQPLFQKRRKQLGAILGRGFPFPPDVQPAQRPEELSVEQFIDMMNRAASR